MKIPFFILLFLSLPGCVSLFAEGGLGYAAESGAYYDIDETGPVGLYGVGIEFQDKWYLPTECGAYHRSQLYKKPEISTNEVACKKRVRISLHNRN